MNKDLDLDKPQNPAFLQTAVSTRISDIKFLCAHLGEYIKMAGISGTCLYSEVGDAEMRDKFNRIRKKYGC